MFRLGEGVYKYDGNRDIVYLMKLCAELQLFVLAAPGPYICAETSGGGFPLWLIGKRDVNIRHTVGTLRREFDPKFLHYELEWWRSILSLLVPFQITNEPSQSSPDSRCLIGLQVENEYFETFAKLKLGLHDEMRWLCYVARQTGITVPLFTNDGFEMGSFIPYSGSKTIPDSKIEFESLPPNSEDSFKDTLLVHGKREEKFGVDLYGFDKYVIFAPVSHPMAVIFGADKYKDTSKWADWNPGEFKFHVDGMEKKVRSFGGAAQYVSLARTLN